jgi:hypothetical protein
MGMMFDTLYNLTDNWYAGMISDMALVENEQGHISQKII